MKNHGDQPFQYSLRSLQYSSSGAASAAWSPHHWQASRQSPNLEYYSFWIFVKIKVISFLPGYFFTTLGAMSIIQVKLAIVKMNNEQWWRWRWWLSRLRWLYWDGTNDDDEQDNHTDNVDSVDSRLLPRPVCSLPCSLVFGEVFLHNALLIIILNNVLINTTIMISPWFSRSL